MIQTITIEQYLAGPSRLPLADVRTPSEFRQGHVPGAFNLPLFTDQERVQVGTTYKQVGREAAILLGFELAGPKWADLIRNALAEVPAKKIAVHCWRGGMRSAAVAWALDLYGFEVYVINGGYKKYRHWAIAQMERPYIIRVLGGMTGSGKTRILHELQAREHQVIDLEQLAGHRGSAYGSMNSLVQPTQEQFENDLGLKLGGIDSSRTVWIEDESSSIGKRIIPRPLWHQLQNAMLIDLQLPIEERVASLVAEYGSLDPQFLKDSTERIRKRLGHEQTGNALLAIDEKRFADFIRIVIRYYDKSYRTGLATREPGKIIGLQSGTSDPAMNASLVLTASHHNELNKTITHDN